MTRDSCSPIYVRIAYDDYYCWSIIRFAHALIQIASALPVLPIPLIYLLTVIPREESIEEYYRIAITNSQQTSMSILKQGKTNINHNA